jgi:hypothetical protein
MSKNKIPTDEVFAKAAAILEKGSLHQAAALLGARGGRRGGPARAARLSPGERKRIAEMGARARWRKRPTQTT